MNQKERRKSIRIPLLTETCTWVCGEQVHSSQVLNITNDGLFIKSDILPEGKDIELRITLPGELGTFQIPGKVIRKSWAKVKKKDIDMGFAVKFEIVQPGHQKIMDSYCIYLRNKQIIQVSKKIIEELFGQGVIPPQPRD